MNDATQVVDRYGVLGYPVSHSRSPLIHRLFANQTGESLHYELVEAAPGNVESAVRTFRENGGKGLNVTVPHKSAVIDLVDEISDRAKTAGAVNTLVFGSDGVFGDNTDGIGLLRDLSVNLGIPLQGANILILGAGGATRGIVGPLLEMHPGSIMIANRTLERAQEIVADFAGDGPLSACRFGAIPVSQLYDLVINATSAGLKGETPPYPLSAISDGTICYDLSYGLKPTPFSLWAREAGAAVSVMGWGMLVEQAAESFEIWRGVRPETQPVLSRMNITV